MKNNIKFYLINHYQRLQSVLSYIRCWKSVKQDKYLGIFDIENIPKNLIYPRLEYVPYNSFYGVEYIFRKYMKVKKPLNIYLEHGLASEKGTETQENSPKYPGKSIVTYGKFRKECLEKSHVIEEIIEVGPYILYADSYYDLAQRDKIKKRYGKILTFFPNHTTERDGNYAETQKYVAEIKSKIYKIKKELKIDTVFVCGYWRDYITGRMELYKDGQYVMVSAGHAMSRNFLPRLRSIIELSDYTLSDAMGTHVMYSVALNVPHKILLNENGLSYAPLAGEFFSWALKVYSEYEIFGTEEERKMSEYLFGLSKHCTREELRKKMHIE